MISIPLNSEIVFMPTSSKWHGKYKNKSIRIALCLYNEIDNIVSMPLSSISAYLKENNANIEIRLFHIVKANSHDERYLPPGFVSYMQQWQPDLFAMSILSTHWDEVKPYLSEIKKVMPELPILVGGYQAILKSEETMDFPAVDFLCDGDGEIPTSNLINYLQGKTDGPVSGLWEKLKDGTILKTPKYNLEDLNSIPFPDYTIYETSDGIRINHLAQAHRTKKNLLPVMTGRGCVYNCTYCSNSTLRKMWPNKKTFLRKYDAERYTDELVRLRDRYHVEYFEFWDELFFGDMEYVYEFFDLYERKIKLPFSVVSRIEVMDYDLCKKAADAGCDAIYFGLESGNEEYRKKYLKRFDKNSSVLEAAAHCKNVGIKRITFNIIGMPFETKSQMLDTLELNRQIDPEFFYFFIYLPLKGTKLYEMANDSGLLYDSLRSFHYYDGLFQEKAKMNIKQIGDSASEDEFNEVRKLMVDYQGTRQML